jgi:hypothetical protein
MDNAVFQFFPPAYLMPGEIYTVFPPEFGSARPAVF